MSGLSKFCGRQPLKNLWGYGLLKHIPSDFLKAVCLPQNLLSSLLNTLSHITLRSGQISFSHFYFNCYIVYHIIANDLSRLQTTFLRDNKRVGLSPYQLHDEDK